MRKSKHRREVERRYDKHASYPPEDALGLVKDLAWANFDESVDVAFLLGIDRKGHGDAPPRHGQGRAGGGLRRIGEGP